MPEMTTASGGPIPTERRPVYVPRVDIFENQADIVLVADMPGVTETSVDVTLDKGVLTLRGRVDPEAGHPGYTLERCEYRVGDYERAFTLAEEIDQDRIEATVKAGVLRLVLPKVQAKVCKIAVRGE